MKKRLPLTGTFELTGRCNLDCRMCYVHVDKRKIQELGFRERTAAEWIAMARQIFDAGTFKLLLTGGEPMLRPDFCEIYEEIAQMGFFLSLYTNATMITPGIMETLKKYPPHTIGVTVYGVSPEIYGKLCGNPDGYQKMLQGLEALLKLPSKIELRTTIVQDNLEEAKKIEAFVKSFGERVTFNINQTVFQSGRGSIGDAAACRLTPQQNARFYCDRYKDMMEEHLQNPEKITEIRLDLEKKNREERVPQEEMKGIYGCNAGWNEYTITWDGRMLPCTLMGDFYTEPFEEGFQAAWDRLPDVMLQPKMPTKCRECTVQQFCGVCPASRYCETGDFDGIPEYFCQLAEVYNQILKQ